MDEMNELDARLDGKIDRQMDGWTEGEMEGQIDGRTDGLMDKVACRVARSTQNKATEVACAWAGAVMKKAYPSIWAGAVTQKPPITPKKLTRMTDGPT